jgi:NhaP-type Na+/H+ or K+/H+ antiporter
VSSPLRGSLLITMLLSLDLFRPLPAAMFLLALAVLAVTALPRIVHGRPMSFPIFLVALGAAGFALPLGLPDPDPIAYGAVVEHATELVVIVALTNAGIRLDRCIGWRSWMTSWRLLGLAMPLTVIGVAVAAWALLGVELAPAILLGAAVSPTDPVLASEVQVGGPGEGSENVEAAEAEPDDPEEEDEVRFALTSEAGLNDALAFPYTNLALVLLAVGGFQGAAMAEWFAIDVVYKLGVGVIVGLLAGRLFAKSILALPASTPTGKALIGVSTIGVTLGAYGLTEWVGGYGFLATFLAAHVLRHSDAEHEYHANLVIFVEQFERLLIAVVLLAIGGYLVRDLIGTVDLALVAFAAIVIFLVRPLCAGLSLIGANGMREERVGIAFFGIRGVGSLYYLAYAVTHGDFQDQELLWAAVATVTLLSILVHGVTASSALARLDRAREARAT